MQFADSRLAESILRALAAEGYNAATPIQKRTIPHVLDGRDVHGSAQTGTGKTAAFALPVLHRLAEKPAAQSRGRRPRCLVLCPTRELARQIADSFTTYGKHLSIRGTAVFGGVRQEPQVKALRNGMDVLVATPGRLQDLMAQGHVDLGGVETLVLDEADRMLDMGFIDDIRRIVEHLPARRQTLLFSVTIPPAIRRLADTLLADPVTVEVAPETPTLETIDQSLYYVQKRNKPALLAHMLDGPAVRRALVFTRTKNGADRVVKDLRGRGQPADAIHGNKTQNARERALKGFRSGRTRVLVATDIAARGIDVDGISHVINYDLTHEPETYVHRIGRTARAGASGAAVSFCEHDEQTNLHAIQRLLGTRIAVRTDCPAYAEPEPRGPRPSSGGKDPRRGGPTRGAGNRGRDGRRNRRPTAGGSKPTGRHAGGRSRQQPRRGTGRRSARS